MSKLLALGLKLDEVIATVTVNPAKMLGLSEVSGIVCRWAARPTSRCSICGRAASISATIQDEHVTAGEIVTPAFSLRAGRRHEVTSPLVPAPLEVAA